MLQPFVLKGREGFVIHVGASKDDHGAAVNHIVCEQGRGLRAQRLRVGHDDGVVFLQFLRSKLLDETLLGLDAVERFAFAGVDRQF